MDLLGLFDDLMEPPFYAFPDYVPRRTVPLRILCHPGIADAPQRSQQRGGGEVATTSHWSETLPMGHQFQPSDVQVKYNDDSVTVSAKRQHHQQDRRGEVYSLMESSRTVPVPKDVDPKSVKAFLTPNGDVKLIAPAPPKDEPMDVAEKDQPEGWNMDLNLEGFKPEELSVKVKGNMLTVSAEHKDETDDHQHFRKVTRVVTVPSTVDAEQLQSIRTDGGVLKLSAPFKKPEQLNPPERNLAIQNEPEAETQQKKA